MDVGAKVIDEFRQVNPAQDTATTIGVFDGVHLGHQSLILRTKEEASARGILSTVVTFRNHPSTVLTPGFEPRYLTGLEQRIELIKSLGVDLVVDIAFTPATSQLSAREFLSLLKDHLRMKVLVAGPDFAMGKGREGDIPTLSRLGEGLGFSLVCVDPTQLASQVVSSTAVRYALAEGDVARASSLLGRPFKLKGRVVAGDKRGHFLGFPTANMDIDPERALPADGIYVTRAYVEDVAYPSVTYIGVRPTFKGLKHSKEVYILDFRGDLYGQDLAIDLIARLRGDVRYSNPEELIHQMNEDVAQARTMLAKI